MLVLLTGVNDPASRAIAAGLAQRLGVPLRSLAPGGDLGLVARQARAWHDSGGALVPCGPLERAEQLRLHRALTAQATVELTSARSDRSETSLPLEVPTGLPTPESVERAYRMLIRRGLRPSGTLRLAQASEESPLSASVIEESVEQLVEGLGTPGRVLLAPPDFTRSPSGAGELTAMLYHRLARQCEVTVLPATGTHVAMTPEQRARMFPGVPDAAFAVHQWRTDLTTLGEVPGSFIEEVSEGRLSSPIPCAVASRLTQGFDRIISVGQLVPHEVIGIANHNKNLFVGLGGKATIDPTHFIGAVYGMERIMGRAVSPVRDVLNYMGAQLAAHLPVTYLLTVRHTDREGRLGTYGLFAGDDESCFFAGAPLAQRLNLDLVDEPLDRVVVYLSPEEFHSTWLGNKAVYRTRMAMADGGELLILAPAVDKFGEDPAIDRLIRRHGYRGTPHVLSRVADDPELEASLSAAAHLIHGSSEGRFRICYAAGGLSREEIEGVGYDYAEPGEALRRYDPTRLKNGPQTLPDGERIFFVSNPALGLWALRGTEGLDQRGT